MTYFNTAHIVLAVGGVCWVVGWHHGVVLWHHWVLLRHARVVLGGHRVPHGGVEVVRVPHGLPKGVVHGLHGVTGHGDLLGWKRDMREVTYDTHTLPLSSSLSLSLFHTHTYTNPLSHIH